ncbi:Mu-like prophage major head subunit gpT family protein [Rhizobium sp. LjRoot30]|uniref:phage major capsid protein n=1 Tax=Rhizobium sp. LjRoot30 TaxID=3342320 RepID=UPI003ECC7927
MTDTNGPLTRAAPLRASSWNAETLTFDLVLSSGAAVERGGFDEVLDLAGAAWPESIPLLADHRSDLDNVLGDVTNIRREGDQIVGTVRLSKHAEKAKRIAAELSDGRSFSGSIGYKVEKWAESKPAGKRTLTAKNWRIYEASLVSLPADPASKIRELPMTESTTLAPATLTRAQINAEVRSIAKTAGLDAAWVDKHVDADDVNLDAVRQDAFAAMQVRTSTTSSVRTISIGTDHYDPVEIRSAMADALAHRLAPNAVKLEGRATEFRSHRILDMVGDLAVARGERVNLRDQDGLLMRAVGAHSTSDFPLLLADAVNKSLLGQYALAAPTYRKWAARKPIADWSAHHFLRIGDVPGFKEIVEGAGVKYGTVSEKSASVSAKEYTSGIAIGRRALMQDNLSALADFSSGFAIRAASDENTLAYAVLAANANLPDGIALFASGHGNLAASGTAIDAANVGLAVKALRAQKSLDGLQLNLQPAMLLCGPANEVAARQLLAAVSPTKSADVNVWSGFAELIVDANITDNAWYIFASPATAPVVVWGHVAGSEGPQVRAERDFDTQSAKIAATLDFAVGAIDHLGAYRNAGT